MSVGLREGLLPDRVEITPTNTKGDLTSVGVFYRGATIALRARVRLRLAGFKTEAPEVHIFFILQAQAPLAHLTAGGLRRLRVTVRFTVAPLRALT